MKKITGKDVIINRFSLSHLVMPASYRHISALGIREDYSMGYDDYPGFRAGLSRPFLFYDLYEEQITRLRIYPFQMTDHALRNSIGQDLQNAKSLIGGIVKEVRRAGGPLSVYGMMIHSLMNLTLIFSGRFLSLLLGCRINNALPG